MNHRLRALRVGIAGGILALSVGCATSTTCTSDPYGRSATCTKSSNASDFLSDLPASVWFIGGLILLGGIATVVDKSSGTTKGPRPTSIAAADLRPGDRVAGKNDNVLTVDRVSWVSATDVEIAWKGGSTQRCAGTMTVTKLPVQ